MVDQARKTKWCTLAPIFYIAEGDSRTKCVNRAYFSMSLCRKKGDIAAMLAEGMNLKDRVIQMEDKHETRSKGLQSIIRQ